MQLFKFGMRFRLSSGEDLNMKANAISIGVGWKLLLKGLIEKNGDEKILLKSNLDLVFEKWSKLSSLNVNNMIQDARSV